MYSLLKQIPTWIARMLGMTATTVGFIVLTGWGLRDRALVQWSTQSVGMAPCAAAALVMCGLPLLLLTFGDRSRRPLAAASAGLGLGAAALGLCILVLYA